MGNLLSWAALFLIIGIVAGVFGFGGAAGTAIEGVRTLFWIAIALAVTALIGGFVQKRRL